MKSVNISKRNNTLEVSVSEDCNSRKSQLYVNEKNAEKLFTNVLTAVKKFSKFKKLSMYYDELDYYDNEVDVYETPTFSFTKGSGKRKPTKSYNRHGCIPKDWDRVIEMKLDDPKTIKPVETFLSQFRITLTAKELKEVRKVMKGEERWFNKEI